MTATNLYNQGTIAAADTSGIVDVALSGTLSNGGAITAGSAISIAAATLNNAGTIRSAGTWLDVSGTVRNWGTLAATGTLQVLAGSVTNVTGGTWTGGTVVVQAISGLSNESGAAITATTAMSLTSSSIANSGTVSSSGDLFAGGIRDATGAITIPLTSVWNDGTLTAAGTAAVTSDYFVNTGLVSGAAVSIVAGAHDLVNAALINTGTIRATGIATASSDPNGTLYLEALNNNGLFEAGSQVSIRAGAISNAVAGTITAPGIVLEASNLFLNAGEILGSRIVSATAATAINDSNATIHSALVVLDTSGAFDNRLGATIASTAGLSLRAGSLTNGGAMTAAGQMELRLAGDLTNSGILRADDVLTVTAADVLNQVGGSLHGSDVGISAATLTNMGTIGASGIVQLGITSAATNSGSITGHDVTISAASFTNLASGSLTATDGLYITTTGDTVNIGTMFASGTLQVVAANFTNAGTSTQAASVNGGTVIIAPSSSFYNEGFATIAATANMSISGATLHNAGALTNEKQLFLTSQGVFGNGGSIIAGTTLVIAGTDLVNQGYLTGASIGLSGRSLINLGSLEADGAAAIVEIALTAGLTNGGSIASLDTISVHSAALTNAGIIRGNGTWLDVSGALANQGSIAGTSALQVTAASVDNVQGGHLSGGTVIVTATGALFNDGTSLIAATTAASLTANTMHNDGHITSDGTLYIQARNGLGNAGLIQAIGAATIDAGLGQAVNLGTIAASDLQITGNTMINTGRIQGSNIVAIAMTSDSTNTGTIVAGNQLSIAISNGSFGNGGSVLARSIWIDARTAVLNNGIIYGSDYLQVTASDIINTGTAAAPAVMKSATTILNATNRLDEGTNSYIEGSNTLSITAPSVSGNSSLLTSQSTTTGLLVYGGNLYIAVANEPVTLPAHLTIAGNLALTTVGDITNTGTISTGGASH